MNDMVWCSSCGTEVSLARAVAELPCPVCGKTEYFVVASDAEQDALLSLAERMQRIGCWEVAEGAFRRCLDQGYITQADFNLSTRTLQWRRECVDAARGFLRSADSSLPEKQLGSLLQQNDFDDYTIVWVMNEYSGFRHVRRGKTQFVEVHDGKQKT